MTQTTPNPKPETERRSYFRVHTQLPMRHRRITSEEAEGYENQFATAQYGGHESLELPLARALRRIENKIDRILLALYPDDEPPLRAEALQPVDLSAGGLRVTAESGLEVGDQLLVEMLVPGAGEDPVQAVARVVRSEPSEQGNEIALEFTAIDENHRDSLLCFTQGVQRRAARGKRGA